MVEPSLTGLPDDILLHVLSLCSRLTARNLRLTTSRLLWLRPPPKTVSTSYSTISPTNFRAGSWLPDGTSASHWGVLTDGFVQRQRAHRDGIIFERVLTASTHTRTVKSAEERSIHMSYFAQPDAHRPLNLPPALKYKAKTFIKELIESAGEAKFLVAKVVSHSACVWKSDSLVGAYLTQSNITSSWKVAVAFVEADRLYIVDYHAKSATIWRLTDPEPNVDFLHPTYHLQTIPKIASLHRFENSGDGLGSLHVHNGVLGFTTSHAIHIWNSATNYHCHVPRDPSIPSQIFVTPTVLIHWQHHHTTPCINIHSHKNLRHIRSIFLTNAYISSLPPPPGSTLPNDPPAFQIQPLPTKVPTVHITPCKTRLLTAIHSESQTGKFSLSGRSAPKWQFRDRTAVSLFVFYSLVSNTLQLCRDEQTLSEPSGEVARDWAWFVDGDGGIETPLTVVSCMGGAGQKREKKKVRQREGVALRAKGRKKSRGGESSGGGVSSGGVSSGGISSGGGSFKGDDGWWNDDEFSKLFEESGGEEEGAEGKEGGNGEGGLEAGSGTDETGGKVLGDVLEEDDFMGDEEFEKLFEDIDKEADTTGGAEGESGAGLE
ncbi:hypothetical protein HDV00_002067 [Rhizophlyctis rosea]|nr:hypothetical protein HDV00_002067 [Rhizophlyctis rosea]